MPQSHGAFPFRHDVMWICRKRMEKLWKAYEKNTKAFARKILGCSQKLIACLKFCADINLLLTPWLRARWALRSFLAEEVCDEVGALVS